MKKSDRCGYLFPRYLDVRSRIYQMTKQKQTSFDDIMEAAHDYANQEHFRLLPVSLPS